MILRRHHRRFSARDALALALLLLVLAVFLGGPIAWFTLPTP